jgi:hypothetical protein
VTRFDVTITRTARSFHHYTVGGDLTIEEEQVITEVLDNVSCRWCGNGNAVEIVTDAGEATEALDA